jgi:hypothetical protein
VSSCRVEKLHGAVDVRGRVVCLGKVVFSMVHFVGREVVVEARVRDVV